MTPAIGNVVAHILLVIGGFSPLSKLSTFFFLQLLMRIFTMYCIGVCFGQIRTVHRIQFISHSGAYRARSCQGNTRGTHYALLTRSVFTRSVTRRVRVPINRERCRFCVRYVYGMFRVYWLNSLKRPLIKNNN